MQLIEIIKRGKFLILDTESTHHPSNPLNDLCQIAIINDQNQVALHTYCKPTNEISEGATAIHGITNAMVAQAPTFAEIADTIESILNGSDVLVYNAKFDRGLLHKAAEHAKLPKREWREIARWHCVMEAFAPIFGDWNSYYGSYRWQPLATAATYYKVEQGTSHDALGDCVTTLRVALAMAAGKVEK